MTFESACQMVRGARRDRPDLSFAPSEACLLYACYKAATVGPVPDRPRPFLPTAARYWDAWKRLGPRYPSQEDARRNYVVLVTRMQKRYSI